MNSILNDIQTIIHTAIKENLPDVSFDDLEEGGKVFYMNGKNGTEFDWFVNEHLPYFMVFYDDKENLGAVKASVYSDGGMIIYLYDDHGRHEAKEVKTFIDVKDSDLLELAVCLRCNADDKSIWDAAIDIIESDAVPEEQMISDFIKNREYYEPSIRRLEILGKLCVVSKKISRDGWKVGFMIREELHDDKDSGWQFMAGDEDDEYINNVENVELCLVNSIAGIDPTILNYIDSPIGSRYVRMSSDEFEADNNQRSYMEKWK